MPPPLHLCATLTLAALASPAVAQDYVVIELYPLSGATDVEAHGVNSHGEIVGQLTISGTTKAFIWLPYDAYGMDAGMNLLDDNFAGFESSIAYDVNDDGVVVGGLELDPGTGAVMKPYVWDLSGSFSSGTINVAGSVAYDINDDAEHLVVGGDKDGAGASALDASGFIFNLDSASLTLLDASSTGNEGLALAISETNQTLGTRLAGLAICSGPLCGQGVTCDAHVDGQYWDTLPGGEELEPIAYVQQKSARVVGHAVNDDLLVAGSGNDPNDPQITCRLRALVWDDNGPEDTPRALPALSSTDEDEAFDIRGTASSGPMEIAGWSKATFQALLWSWNGSSWDLVNLNDGSVACKAGVLGTLRQASGNNADGWIAGHTNGTGWLLIPEDDYHTNVCPADFANGNPTTCPDGQVDVFDLFVLLNNWGTDGDGAALAAPTNVVDVFDLFEMLDSWGICIGDPPPPDSLETVVTEAGLTMDDWDEFEDVMAGEDEKPKENYNCWMQRYLSGCTTCPPCPDDDPFAN